MTKVFTKTQIGNDCIIVISIDVHQQENTKSVLISYDDMTDVVQINGKLYGLTFAEIN